MSPIHNLTNVPHSFIKLGNIRKGEMREKNGVTRPVDLDYFRVTFAPGAQAEAVEHAFRAAYGDKPTEINVRFAEPDPNQVWDAFLECYKAGGLIAQAGSNENGLYWQFYRDPEGSEVLVRGGLPVGEDGARFMAQPIDIAKPIYLNSKGEGFFLEPVGRLQVVIPETAGVAVGYFVFQPGSPRDIRNISAELGAYAAMAKQYGKSITGIPFVLRRREEEITKNIKGKLSKGPSWVVHLDAGGDWGMKALNVIERLALPEVIDAVGVRDLDRETVIPDDPYEQPIHAEDFTGAPDEPEPVQEQAPATTKAKPRTEEQATMIDPTAADAVTYAAKTWNITPADAAKAIYKGIKSGKFANPMSKSAFKEAVG